jgi:AI-2 transport protein TqsA
MPPSANAGNDGQSDRRTQTACLLILTGIGVGHVLHWAAPMMIPFLLALFAAFALTPLVDLLVRRWRLPRLLAVAVALLCGIALLLATALLASVAVSQLADNVSMYQDRFRQMIAQLQDSHLLKSLGIDPGAARKSLSSASPDVIRDFLQALADAVMVVISNGTLVLIFLAFLLAGNTALAGRSDGVMAGPAALVRRYLIAQFLLSALTGVLVGLSLWMVGVDLALTFGFLAFVLNAIPTVGCIIATLLPLPIVMLAPGATVTQVVLALLIPGTIQMLLGNVVVPRVMGKSLDLHPVTILIALILWGLLWGMIGVVLAVPLTAVLRIWFEKLSYTRPLARLMAGQSPYDADPVGATPLK